MILLDRLSKAYDGRPVLEKFSLILPDRGIVALKGPSGCGKTTLLRLLAGLDTPDSGSIEGMAGRRISVVFQEDRLLPWRTARDNLALVRPEATPAEIDRLLETLGLKGEGDKFPDALSGGMRRRVAVGRALLYGGDIYLLDEPFTGLDPETKARVMQPFAALGKERLILLITHDAAEAERLAGRVLTASGPPLRVEG